MQPDSFNALAIADSPEALAAALDAVCREAGLAHFLVVRMIGPQLEEVIQVLENAPTAAGDVKGLGHWSIARMLDRMRRGGAPVLFGQGAEPPIELPGYSSGVATLSRERHGATVFYFGSSAPALEASQLMHAMRCIVLAAQFSLQGLANVHARTCPLSETELLCLQHFLAGLSAKETAKALDVSPRTIEHHLESIRKRFNVETTAAAAYKAVHQGWVELPARSAAANG